MYNILHASCVDGRIIITEKLSLISIRMTDHERFSSEKKLCSRGKLTCRRFTNSWPRFEDKLQSASLERHLVSAAAEEALRCSSCHDMICVNIRGRWSWRGKILSFWVRFRRRHDIKKRFSVRICLFVFSAISRDFAGVIVLSMSVFKQLLTHHI